jgi:hypothetical protein
MAPPQRERLTFRGDEERTARPEEAASAQRPSRRAPAGSAAPEPTGIVERRHSGGTGRHRDDGTFGTFCIRASASCFWVVGLLMSCVDSGPLYSPQSAAGASGQHAGGPRGLPVDGACGVAGPHQAAVASGDGGLAALWVGRAGGLCGVPPVCGRFFAPRGAGARPGAVLSLGSRGSRSVIERGGALSGGNAAVGPARLGALRSRIRRDRVFPRIVAPAQRSGLRRLMAAGKHRRLSDPYQKYHRPSTLNTPALQGRRA